MMSVEQPHRGLYVPKSATATPAAPAPEPVANMGRLIRIQSSVQALLGELHGLHEAPDPATRHRLVDLERELTQALDDILDERLRLELHRLVLELPLQGSSADEIRIALAQLDGWLTGLLTGLTIVVPDSRVGTPPT